MSESNKKDLIVEEARQEYHSWVRANRNLNNKASIFIGINTFILLSVVNFNLSRPVWLFIISVVGISTLFYLLVLTRHMGFNPETYSSTDELMRLSNLEREKLQEALIYKYGTAEGQRKSIRRKSKFLKVGFFFTMLSLGGASSIFILFS